MNRTHLKGDSKQTGGQFEQKSAEQTDDGFLLVEDDEASLSKLQDRAGMAEDEDEEDLDSFVARLHSDAHAFLSK